MRFSAGTNAAGAAAIIGTSLDSAHRQCRDAVRHAVREKQRPCQCEKKRENAARYDELPVP